MAYGPNGEYIRCSKMGTMNVTRKEQRGRTHTSLLLAAMLLAVSAAVGCGSNSPPEPKPTVATQLSTAELILKARRQLALRQYDEASSTIQRVLIESPGRTEAVFLAAEVAAARGDTDRAVELAGTIPIDDGRFGKKAANLRLQQLAVAGRDEVAISDLRRITLEQPQETQWRHLSWSLLSKHGRRQEASTHADALCVLGGANLAEVMSLVERNAPFPRGLALDKAKQVFASGLGMARWHFANGSFAEAKDALTSQKNSGFPNSASAALYGRILAETQQWEDFDQWHQGLDETATRWSDYWAAIGARLMTAGQHEAATRAFLEAISRDKTDRISYQRAYGALTALGRDEDADQMLLLSNQLGTSQLLMADIDKSPADRGLWKKQAEWLTEIGRPFEAIQWYMNVLPPSATRERMALDQHRMQLNSMGDLESVMEQIQLAATDPKQFSLQPGLDTVLPRKMADRPDSESAFPPMTHLPLAGLRLRNVAQEVGVDFQWRNDQDVDLELLALYESLGGGIAVLDFDLDGWPDLYLAQGGSRPPDWQATASNEMLRNVAGQFAKVTLASATEDFGYTQGIAVGDLNQDGFPDLLLGAIGRNRILINNGDGTFQDRTELLGENVNRFTTSVAISDLTGDGLPELVEANYLRWDNAFSEPLKLPDGTYEIPGPADHEPELDRWYECSPDGYWTARPFSEDSKVGSGLGILITDLNGKQGNEVFIANDARPNHVWIREDGKWLNAADTLGLAHGFEGLATAAMGIAASDFNRDAQIDLHVTNFRNEASSLYLRSQGQAYADSAVRYGLDRLTRPMVGFGTKAVDFDRDGWPDIAITNGHVFDRLPEGQTFAMPPQLIMNHGDHFELSEPGTESGYFADTYVGRAMASLDFDRDGRLDLAIGHLDQKMAILRNETETEGRSLQLELVATGGERNAVGSKVTVVRCGERSVHWITAGDGFLSSDERFLDIGIGRCDQIDRVEVEWPSGRLSSFEDLRVDARYLLIEDDPIPFEREVRKSVNPQTFGQSP